jgi:hypothetical protein
MVHLLTDAQFIYRSALLPRFDRMGETKLLAGSCEKKNEKIDY